MSGRAQPVAVLAMLVLAMLGGATPSAAEEPASAIPWLSESLREMDPPERPLPRPGVPGGGAPVAAPDQPTIATTLLGGIALDAVGLLPPEETGFARTLWGPATAAEVRAAILAHPDRGVPEARALFRRILLAEADPPRGSGADAAVLMARVDRLLGLGALEEAEALLERAGPETPELFRRYFDVGLLLDRAQPACEALKLNAGLSPTLPARIFCLARDGDWNAAEITLTLGRDLGELDAAEEAALARFLDPALFEGSPDPDPPEPLTPLDFLLREAVGLPRPAHELPPAFLHKDLADYLPMRTRVAAGEILLLNGAVAPEILFEAYRTAVPAASGGLWDRARAVQALDRALGSDARPEELAVALAEADRALAARGLRVAFADTYAPALAALNAASLDETTQMRRLELLLLAGEIAVRPPHPERDASETPDADPARAAPLPEPSPPYPASARTRALLEVAGLLPPSRPAQRANEPLLNAAQAGLTDTEPQDSRSADMLARLGEGRQGEVLLEALALVGDGPEAPPPALRTTLFLLREAGLDPVARQIALETVLTGHGGERAP